MCTRVFIGDFWPLMKTRVHTLPDGRDRMLLGRREVSIASLREERRAVVTPAATRPR